MKPIFNSLGSHYSWSFAKQALGQLAGADLHAPDVLRQTLAHEYDGTAFLFFKGRDAIEFALRTCAVQADDIVLTQALACHAIEEAIVRAGAKPGYVDVVQDGVNLNLDTVKEAYARVAEPKKVRALIVQHTLGVPVQIAPLKKWCASKHIVLIEDLAQSFGAQDSDGTQLGSLADIVIFSFGRDKVVDALSGGACCIKQQELQPVAQKLYAAVPNLPLRSAVMRDMFYPMLTWWIRRLHGGLLAAMLFYLGKAFGILSSPTLSSTSQMNRMPSVYASLALESLSRVESQLYLRRQLARTYLEALKPQKSFSHVVDEATIQAGAMLRFPLLIEKPDQLTLELTKDRIFITDRWYRSAVDSGSLGLSTVYAPGTCPHAEDVAKRVLNLPTHQEVSKEDALRIVETCLQRM